MAKNAAVKALLKPTSEHGRNVFPLDTKQVYSMKFGHINPVKTFHFMPGDHFQFQVSDFSLSFPAKAAPFLRGRKEFAFYSVYYNAIWSLFNQYQGQKNDPKTSAFGAAPTLIEPRIALGELYFACLSNWLYTFLYDTVFPIIFDDGNVPYAFLDLPYGVGDPATAGAKAYCLQYIINPSSNIFIGFDKTIAFSSSSAKLNAFNALNIEHAMFASEIQLRAAKGTPLTVKDFIEDVVGHHRAYNWMRKLDMLGYGNIYPVVKAYEHNIVTQLSELSPETSLADICTLLNSSITSLFMDIFNSCFTYEGDTVSGTFVPKMVNVYPICAYNLIFYHFFRNTYYDLDYRPENYNLDYLSINDNLNMRMSLQYKMYLRFFDIEYHQWKKDTFTAVLPDTQFGAVSSVSVLGTGSTTITGTATLNGTTSDDVGRWSTADGSTLSNRNDVMTSDANLLRDTIGNLKHSHLVTGTASLNAGTLANVVSSFDVIALKRAEMLQQYRQQLMRAGNRTSDVFRAIYGGAPSSEHEDDVIPRFLETFGEDIFVDPVTATANTGDENINGQLGDLASRAKLSGQSPKFSFNAGNNFGVILALAYIVPSAEYNSYMIDKHLQELTPEQHFIPQLDNFGLEPIYSDELNSLLPQDSLSVLGYGPAYHHKKSSVDMVHGAFCSYNMSFLRESGNIRAYGRSQFFGEFNIWVSPRTDMQGRSNTLIRDFYINPSVVDNIFMRAASADQADDQFICNTYFDVKSTRQMSVIGLINFV